jgi:hypothetical protein
MPTPPIDYHALARQFGGTSAPSVYVAHESKDAVIPPELERIQSAIGVQYKQGPSRDNGDSIASVEEHEPHVIEINDKARFNQGPLQTRGHEIVHLLFSHLPAKLQEQIPKDDPNHPYDISQADEWRAQGKKLWNLPQEAAATLIQTWISDPSQRKRLQPWMSDLTSVPLSVENPTSPNDKGINTTPRAPVPPIEAYLTPAQMKARADELKQEVDK